MITEDLKEKYPDQCESYELFKNSEGVVFIEGLEDCFKLMEFYHQKQLNKESECDNCGEMSTQISTGSFCSSCYC